MTDKPWKDLSPAERSQRMREGKEKKAAERRAAPEEAEAVDPAPAKIAVPPDLFGSVEFTDDEIADIYARARVKVAEERKAAKKAAMMQAALEEARREAGLIVDDPKDLERERLNEIVPTTIDIPEGGARDGDYIWLDGKSFMNGITYQKTTRAQYETLRDIINKQWVEWAKFKGERSNHYNRMRGRYESAYGGGTPTGTGGRGLAVPHGGVPAHIEQELAI